MWPSGRLAPPNSGRDAQRLPRAKPLHYPAVVTWVIPLLLLLLMSPLVVAILRINELFVLRPKAGKLVVVRGRVPPKLLHDLDDVLRGAGHHDVGLRAVVEDGRATLYPEGAQLPAGVRQQLRNTISLWPVAKIRNAPRRAKFPPRT